MQEEKRIKKIENTIRRHFTRFKFEKITVEDTEDSDGDPVIVINIIYDPRVRTIDAGDATRVTRLLRRELPRIGEKAFPIFWFVTKADWEDACAVA